MTLYRFARTGPVVLAAGVLATSCAPVQQLRNVSATGSALIETIAQTGAQPQLSALGLRQLQSRDFATTRASAFASVVTVLLDSGYRVLTADLDSGLVTATASTTGRLRFDPSGIARANETPLASAFIEERGSGTVRVRVSFSIGRTATGTLTASGEQAVSDPAPYEIFFAQLASEIAERPAAVPRRAASVRETESTAVEPAPVTPPLESSNQTPPDIQPEADDAP